MHPFPLSVIYDPANVSVCVHTGEGRFNAPQTCLFATRRTTKKKSSMIQLIHNKEQRQWLLWTLDCF